MRNGPASSGRKRRRASFVLGAILFGLSLGFAAGEVILRLLVPTPTHYRARHPGLRVTFLTHHLAGVQGPVLFEINSMGVRGREWSPDRSSEYRILCVGGSTTESPYTDNTRVWPHLLEERLGSLPDGRRVWVGNIGRSGLRSTHHVLQIERLLPVYDPDLVIVLVGINDLTRYLARGARIDSESIAELEARAFAVYPGGGAFGAITWPGDPWFKKLRLWNLGRSLGQLWRERGDGLTEEGNELVRWRDLRAAAPRLTSLPGPEGGSGRLRAERERARGKGPGRGRDARAHDAADVVAGRARRARRAPVVDGRQG